MKIINQTLREGKKPIQTHETHLRWDMRDEYPHLGLLASAHHPRAGKKATSSAPNSSHLETQPGVFCAVTITWAITNCLKIALLALQATVSLNLIVKALLQFRPSAGKAPVGGRLHKGVQI